MTRHGQYRSGCPWRSATLWTATRQQCLPPNNAGIYKPAAGEDQAIGRSRGGLSTKIHTLVDALGNPLGFFLTGGEAHDLVGADHLLPTMEADMLIADKAFDADERVLEPLAAAGKTAVIPPRANPSSLRDYDRQLYGERHLIENFSPGSSSSVRSPLGTRKPRATSWPRFTSSPASFGSIDDRP
jgi:transposase